MARDDRTKRERPHAKAPVPRTDGDRALHFILYSPNEPLRDPATRKGFLALIVATLPIRAVALNYLGLTGTLPWNPLPSVLRMSHHVYTG